MREALVAGLLVVMVAAAWLGCLGFARLRAPLDRLHAATFINVVGGGALVLVAFIADGASDRALKILLAVAVSVGAGAASSHAVARALVQRGAGPGAGARDGSGG